MKEGTKVRIRQGAIDIYKSPHIGTHMRYGDIGEIAPPSPHAPKMATLYKIVRFACGHTHRLREEELEEAE